MSGPGGYGPGHGPCDRERVFELADGSLEGQAAGEVWRHLERCAGCRGLYERELDMNSRLGSLDLLGTRSCSVYRTVAMALPTRSPWVRLLWTALAVVLLVLALVYLEFSGVEPVILAMSVLAACWGLVTGSAGLVHTVLAAAGSTILVVLALGALADVLIVLALLRGRRAREA